jgi:hypothetical protein
MKSFIYKTLSFIILLLVLVFGFEQITAKLIVSNTDFQLKNKPQYLVLGHSQPEHAFNDSLINGLKNLAEGGESYFWTYHKFKEVIKQNPSINTVFIAFTNNNIEQKRDAWTWDCYYMSSRLDRFAPLISIKGKLKLAYRNPYCFVNTMSFELKERFDNLSDNNLIFTEKLGGYKITEKKQKESYTPLNQEELRLQLLNAFDPQHAKVSKHNLFYLDKLIKLCHKEGKKVVLMRLPQKENYEFWKNENQFQNVRHKYYANLPFLDFTVFPTTDDDFIDPSHMSYKGAKRFSIWIDQLLQTHRDELIQGNLDLLKVINL